LAPLPRCLGGQLVYRAPVLLTVLCFALGCTSTPQPSADTISQGKMIERYCSPPSDVGRPVVLSQPAASLSSDEDISALEHFSPQALEIADIIGVENLLLRLAALEDDAARKAEVSAFRLILIRQEISDRILLSLLDIRSAAAEANCEEERADAHADQLQEKRDARARRFTIFAVLAGGLVGILSGGLNAADPTSASGGIAAMVAGGLSSVFGAAALFDDPRYEFRHGRNLLRDVLEGPERSSLFPSSVWRFLNQPLRDDPEHRSRREILIARWRQDGRFGNAGSDTEQRRIALFFGPGGIYEIEDLRARAAMMDLLEADIDLMSHDLERLLHEVLARKLPILP